MKWQSTTACADLPYKRPSLRFTKPTQATPRSNDFTTPVFADNLSGVDRQDAPGDRGRPRAAFRGAPCQTLVSV